MIGWGNVSINNDKRGDKLTSSFGYAKGKAPRDAAFRRGLEEEMELMRVFLGLPVE